MHYSSIRLSLSPHFVYHVELVSDQSPHARWSHQAYYGVRLLNPEVHEFEMHKIYGGAREGIV